MEKRKEIFHDVFNYYLEKENSNYESYLEKHPGGSWKDFLFPEGETGSNQIEFVESFLFYLDQGYPTEEDQIIPALNALTAIVHSRTYQFCAAIKMLLYATKGDDFSALAVDTICKVHNEFVSQEESTPYHSFLGDFVTFLSAIYPDFYHQERDEITDPVFCSFALRAILSNDSFTPHSSYIHHALHASSPRVFFNAITCGGLISLKGCDYQAAYDILYPLFHMKMVGAYKDIPREFSDSDINWRNRDIDMPFYKSIMSLLCSGMADLQRRGSIQHKAFRNKAISYAEEVLSVNEYDYDDFDNCVFSLINSNCYKTAAKASVDMLTDLRKTEKPSSKSLFDTYVSIILCYLGGICSNNRELNPTWQQLSEILEEFYNIYQFSSKTHTEINESEYNSILCIFERSEPLPTPQRTDIAGLLMCTYHLVQKIKSELWDDSYIQTIYYTHEEMQNSDAEATESDERSPTPIAYYTTLENLKYLLDPVYANSYRDRPRPLKDFGDKEDIPKSSKNCLTMMHAHYMNDPREGIALPDALSDWIDQKSSCKNILFRNNSPETFRERLFDNLFVFLKSFTDIIDQLNMWSMYGSNRSDGSDSNGCCVRIDPKTFENMLSVSHKTSILTDLDKNHDTDDLRLYKIAYLKDNALVAPKSNDLEHYFEQLKEMVQKLNDLLASDKGCAEEDVKVITQLLQEILTPIIFLFKDASYQGENERRLIVTRSRTKEDMERISKTPQDPPKLYVNPYHQIFVDQIILGPKVKEPDAWIPHLQFELTKMWENWPAKNGEKQVPSVRKSSINYRD